MRFSIQRARQAAGPHPTNYKPALMISHLTVTPRSATFYATLSSRIMLTHHAQASRSRPPYLRLSHSLSTVSFTEAQRGAALRSAAMAAR